MPRQLIGCKFPGSRRTYTYHNDREPVAVGDRVVVSTDRGPATVEVVELWDPGRSPGFQTKPIVGKERPIEDPAPAIPPAADNGGTDAGLQSDREPGGKAPHDPGEQSPFGR